MQACPLPANVLEFLEHNRVARLATVDGTGKPQVVPICYAISDDCLYFVIDRKPKPSTTRLSRLRNIAANPRVAIVVDRYSDDWTQLGFVQLEGLAEIEARAAEYTHAMSILRQRYPAYRDMQLEQSTNPLVRVTLVGFHSWGLLAI